MRTDLFLLSFTGVGPHAANRPWKKMFMEFNAGLKIVRMVPTKIPGDLGYEAELQRDARKMQGHFDEWWLCAKELIGASVLRRMEPDVPRQHSGRHLRAPCLGGYVLIGLLASEV